MICRVDMSNTKKSSQGNDKSGKKEITLWKILYGDCEGKSFSFFFCKINSSEKLGGSFRYHTALKYSCCTHTHTHTHSGGWKQKQVHTFTVYTVVYATCVSYKHCFVFICFFFCTHPSDVSNYSPCYVIYWLSFMGFVLQNWINKRSKWKNSGQQYLWKSISPVLEISACFSIHPLSDLFFLFFLLPLLRYIIIVTFLNPIQGCLHFVRIFTLQSNYYYVEVNPTPGLG